LNFLVIFLVYQLVLFLLSDKLLDTHR
jgi:hypothetical protein